MTTPALPQQVLVAQANALAVGERALPFAAPPISQSLISIANALPLGALPALPVPGAAGGLPFPVLGGVTPLGGVPNILASLGPAAPVALRARANGLTGVVYPRTGLG